MYKSIAPSVIIEVDSLKEKRMDAVKNKNIKLDMSLK